MITALMTGILFLLIYNIFAKKKCDCTEEPEVWWHGNIDNGYNLTDDGLEGIEVNLFIDDMGYKAVNRDGKIILEVRDKDSFDFFEKWMNLADSVTLVKPYKRELRFESGGNKGTLLGCFPTSIVSDNKKYVITLSYDGYKIII